jgi:hypothetical protein
VFVVSSPLSAALNTAHYDVPILINDTNFGAIGTPAHISYSRLFTVIDHLLEPLSFVPHIDNDQSVRITCSHLTILFVPANDVNVA